VVHPASVTDLMMVLQDGRMKTECLLKCAVEKRALVVDHVDGMVSHTLNLVTYLFLYLGMVSELVEHPLPDLSVIDSIISGKSDAHRDNGGYSLVSCRDDCPHLCNNIIFSSLCDCSDICLYYR
jgi:hypothetical protein